MALAAGVESEQAEPEVSGPPKMQRTQIRASEEVVRGALMSQVCMIRGGEHSPRQYQRPTGAECHPVTPRSKSLLRPQIIDADISEVISRVSIDHSVPAGCPLCSLFQWDRQLQTQESPCWMWHLQNHHCPKPYQSPNTNDPVGFRVPCEKSFD